MPEFEPTPGCLVLYRAGPALVTGIGEKIEIALPGDKAKRVRIKDIVVLHPGPLQDFSELEQDSGDVWEAWELIAGEAVSLRELAELLYGEFTPAAAWGGWCELARGLVFEGTPDRVIAREKRLIDRDIADRDAKATAQREWEGLLDRLQRGVIEAGDADRLKEVEKLALAQSQHSRILAALGLPESPEAAHRLLVRVGVWKPYTNPYPLRLGVSIKNPSSACSSIPDEPRVDLTHLPAFAIDDQGSDDPDDAVSLDGQRIWVHVADVSALVTPGSALDSEARDRGANLYLPEKMIYMLPPQLTQLLGLGLADVSPALSFGFRLSEQMEPIDLQIVPSRVRVQRKSYSDVERMLTESPFSELIMLAECFRQRRLRAGAMSLQLPETRVRVTRESDVEIKPVAKLASREMVTELMLMAGEAVARHAMQNHIPIPFTLQSAPDISEIPTDLAGMYACRRQLRPSRQGTQEGPHSGLGLEVYARATSPLRRYLDLVVHQQLRAHLRGANLLTLPEISERVNASEPGVIAVRKTERLSNLHWKLVYLRNHPGWRGRAIVVGKQERRKILILPELALETRISGGPDLSLNQELEVVLRKVDIPDQMAWFKLA
ncbi:MAG: RNB domain-containing ribonuclease [Gammaproteobacteria bacterium]|nr:RNB domain-containing ribonuclease [Gammaproteobacteria bacterium]